MVRAVRGLGVCLLQKRLCVQVMRQPYKCIRCIYLDLLEAASCFTSSPTCIECVSHETAEVRNRRAQKLCTPGPKAALLTVSNVC